VNDRVSNQPAAGSRGHLLPLKQRRLPCDCATDKPAPTAKRNLADISASYVSLYANLL
jgi:hypothetical protein